MPISPVERQLNQWLFAGKFFWQGRLMVARLFQRALSELGMGRFVTYSGRTATGGEVFDRNVEAVLNAFTIYLGLPLVLNFSGDYIKNAPYARAFFSKWKITDEYFSIIEKQDPSKHPYGSWQTYRDLLLVTLPHITWLYNLFDPRSSFRTGEQYKHAWVLFTYNLDEVNEADTAVALGNKLEPTTSPDVLFTTKFDNISDANPFIALETKILFSYVYLLQTYREFQRASDAKSFVPPFLKHQTAKAILDGEVITRQSFDSYGRIAVEVPKKEKGSLSLTLDTYGLSIITPFTQPEKGEPAMTMKLKTPGKRVLSVKVRASLTTVAPTIYLIMPALSPTVLTSLRFTKRVFSATITESFTAVVEVTKETKMKLTLKAVPKKQFAMKAKTIAK